jgi:hypothetical protein
VFGCVFVFNNINHPVHFYEIAIAGKARKTHFVGVCMCLYSLCSYALSIVRFTTVRCCSRISCKIPTLSSL